MFRKVIVILLAVLALLCVAACNPDTTPFQVLCSIKGNGTGFQKSDNALRSMGYTRTFYLNDNLVFNMGSTLVKREYGSGNGTNLLPENMVITDKQYLAIDRVNSQLYFAADYAIWKVNFTGANLTRISPENRSIYSAPALSPCGNYLTAIKDKRIARLNLNTGIWTELLSPVTAEYSVYFSDTDEYIFYSANQESYSQRFSLCKLNGVTQDSTWIMSESYDVGSRGRLNLQSSRDHRYFAMHCAWDPQLIPNWMGYDYWERYDATLWTYDRQSGNITSIPNCYSYAFVPDNGELLYSRYKLGMSDLMRMDMVSGESTMVWDGYYAPNLYSYSIRNIYPRDDGQKIHIDTWVKPKRSNNNS